MTDTLEQRARGLLASEFPLADGFSAVLVRDMSIPQLGVVDTAIALRAIVAALQAQQPGAQAVAPYAYEFEQLMFDSMGGWERRIERRLPAKHDDPSRVRDIKPLYLGHPPSIPEPTAEHWRMAIKERGIENPKALDWIEQRARELAQEGE